MLEGRLSLMEICSVQVYEEFLIHIRTCPKCKTKLEAFMKESDNCENFKEDIKNLGRSWN